MAMGRGGWLGTGTFLVAALGAAFLALLVPLGAASTPGADATLNPTALGFADRPVGTRSDAKTVSLTNNGDAPLAISTVRITGPDAGDFRQGIDCPIAP